MLPCKSYFVDVKQRRRKTQKNNRIGIWKYDNPRR